MPRTYKALVQSAVIAMVVAACAEYPPLTPHTASEGAPLMSLSSQQPTLFKNAARYADQLGTMPALSSARSGAVTLSARALLNTDGSVTLVVTTGDIDSEIAPGVLAHVQVKLSDPQGREKRTLNFHDYPTGRAEIPLPTGARGSKIHVMAVVRGITRSAEVVEAEVETFVKMYPDLQVGSFNAPLEAVVNTPVSIEAVVTETNGDYPASADCVLFEDGAEISRASGIWVNAGRSVTCAFLPKFKHPGKKQLKVSVLGVVPGDWDDSNNSMSTDITVLDPRPVNEFNWNGQVTGRSNIRGIERSEGFWELPDYEQRMDWSYFKEYLGEGWRDANVDGRRSGAVIGPLSATYKDRIDQTVLNDGAFQPTTDSRISFEGDQFHPDFGMVHVKQACSSLTRTVPVNTQRGPVFAQVARLNVCSNIYSGPPGAETLSETFFSYTANAGDVTYYANDYSLYVAPGFQDAYSFNGNVAYSFGTPSVGSEYVFEITVTGAEGTTMTASGTIPLTYQEQLEVIPWQCTEYISASYSERSCSETNLSYTGFGGSASGSVGTSSALRASRH